MKLGLRSRKAVAIMMTLALVWSCFGMTPNRASADAVTATLVGDLQTELGGTADWEPADATTLMQDLGDGNYVFTGELPAGTYQYKIALNGTWAENYGFSNYTNPAGVDSGGNIKLVLAEATTVTFYYNHTTRKIADSTYYTPIAADKLPRLVGDLQTELGDEADGAPDKAGTFLADSDFDNVYTVVKTLPEGTYAYQVVLGSTSEDPTYPEESQSLVLPQELPVNFKYNAVDNSVGADFTIPVDPGSEVPEGFLRVHYNGDPENIGLWLFNDVASPSTNWPTGASAFAAEQTDSYGVFQDIPLAANAKKAGMVVVNRVSGAKDGGDKVFTLTSAAVNEVWLQEGSDVVTPYEPVELAPNTIRIHYTRSDNTYINTGLWLFGDVAVKSEELGSWPTAATPFAEEDRYGGYIDVAYKENAQKINFIALNRETGNKDGDTKEFALMNRYSHIWIKEGDNNVYISPYSDLATAIVSAEVTGVNKILSLFTMTEGLDATALKSAIAITDSEGESVTINKVVIKDETTVEIDAALNLDKLPLSITYSGRTVSASTGWRMLDSLYTYDGDDLGAKYNANGTATLKLWAPTASAVVANVYDKDDSTELIGSYPLTKGEQGVWSETITVLQDGNGVDSEGYFYQYEVTNNGVTKKVLDPYAKSMAPFTVNTKGEAGPDGDTVGKAAIVDLSGTNPEGYDFAQIDGYEKREDAIVLEMHVRDFTSDPSIEGDLNARWGTYNAFAEKLDYIKSLGVTHIQLMPIMAWYFGDETKAGERENEYSALDNEYNWGYDPHNYFTPDGAYSEDPADPELRVKELKDMINAIHEAGMGVILDVVYTHMAQKELLNDIVPGYYQWIDANGNFVGGFTNNLATNHIMSEKLMVDSVKYWFDEYKIDGMRWDMMGDATYEAVQHAYDEAITINPDALFIGEGWRTFSGAVAEPALAGHSADQDWMDKTDNVGVFSDEFRNELKSGYGSEGQPRFITGGARSISTIFNNIKGQPSNINEDDPGDIVSYIEAHDNLPLYDVIAQSIKKNPAIPADDLEIHQRVRLGNLLVLTSQGTAFLQVGQEYGRTKQWNAAGEPEQKSTEFLDENGNHIGYFVHDSYDSSDAINKFDWAKATDEAAYPVNNITKEYTSGLMKLRNSTDAFSLGDQDLVNSNVTLIDAPQISAEDLFIAYKNKATDGTGQYYVFLNADNEERTITLTEDLQSGTVVVDNDEAGIAAVSAPSGFTLTADSITLDPLTAVIIKKDAPAATLASLELDSASYSVAIGSEHQTTVYAKYDDGSKRKVTAEAAFASSKPGIASVSAAGKVKGLSLGTTAITVTYNGLTAVVDVTVTKPVDKRYVQINYIRPDKDYTDWNLWVWGTGVKDDQIDFTKVENGIATVNLEVAEGAASVGFVLRKGTDWNTAKQDIGYDRNIPIEPGAMFTKVNVTSMVGALDILPSTSGPLLNDGNVTFVYRDEALFKNGQMNTIASVKVKVGDNEYQMAYDAGKEWFSYTLHNVAVGAHDYSFIVERAGTTTEVNDPNNIVDGKSSFEYRKPTMTITSAFNPAAIASNENGVLSLDVTPSEPVVYREAYIDLTALGGSAKATFDTELMAQTLSVEDKITAGAKNVTVTLIDVYGNKHQHTATVNVKARTYTDDKLDFDWDEARIYFTLTDRFADGDSTNNENVDKTHLEAYHGGDFRGMIDKLDYIQDLGINTIWITPIVDNIDFNKGVDFDSKQYGYHGYWAKDFTQIDEHLGDLDTFKELIDKAHDRGIKIMVDVVLNHTGYGVKPEDDYPTIAQEDKDRFAGMLRTDDVQASTNPIRGEVAFLPDFKTEEPAVREKVIDWQTSWLNRAKTDRGDTIDYFRVDTVKHVESTTWKAFRNALTEINPEFKMIGEQFGATVDTDGGTLGNGQMDSLLDFGFKGQVRDFANGSIDAVDAYLQDRESKMNNTKTMGQFLSSHDEDGFLVSYVGGDKGKLKIAAALQITAKGQPVIYYGEELGRSGKNAGDMSEGEFSENRGDMPWDKLTEEAALHNHYKKLLNIRAKFSKVYAKGQRSKLGGSDAEGFMAFNKRYGSTNIVTVINVKTAAKTVTISVPFASGSTVTDEYSGTTYGVAAGKKVTFSLPGMNEGGTVILSLLSGPSGNTSTGETTGVSDTQVVEESGLQNGQDGKVEVPVEAGKQAVQLPINAANALGNSDLELNAGSISVTFPNEVLQQAGQLVSGTAAEGAQIRFEFKPLPAQEGNALIENASGHSLELKSASPVYELKLYVITADGKRIEVTQFTQPIVIKLQATGELDESLVGIYYIGEDGKLTYVGGKVENGQITGETTHFSKYAALEYNKTFADVSGSHWASSVIKALTAKQIVTGVSETKFAPEKSVTRAELAAMLVRALGLKAEGEASYSDVAKGAWYAPFVAAASKAGIVKGNQDGTFGPNATITREEMATMIVRALEVKNGGKAAGAAAPSEFTDRAQVSAWAVAYVDAAAKLGLVKGRANGQFAPQGVMTRAEGAQVIFNLLGK
ncbi:pullulanase [Paenibacillus sp. NEAU-GSW1]|uniref:pullulanase n=1 Tax=Paenibacillus sp. NEAU-GSW1 TaxID=2682486 RepID=UPI0012E31AFA|nr:pullulanase [Paenibacillus sp. NEAU-GSW1]MUT64624.1 pullulanase [Paenibacillus sp. NEAU-GSW1]